MNSRLKNCNVENNPLAVAVEVNTEQEVLGYTLEIRRLISCNSRNTFEIGQILLAVKAKLGHGKFRIWIKSEFDWSLRTAARFMQVALRLESVDFSEAGWGNNISVSALYALTESSTTKEARDEIIRLASEGIYISNTQAREIIKKNKNGENPGILEDNESTLDKTEKTIVKDLESPSSENKTISQFKIVSRNQAKINDFLVGHSIYLEDMQNKQFRLIGKVIAVHKKSKDDDIDLIIKCFSENNET